MNNEQEEKRDAIIAQGGEHNNRKLLKELLKGCEDFSKEFREVSSLSLALKNIFYDGLKTLDKKVSN